MKVTTVYLKDDEIKNLMEIKNRKGLGSFHAVIKLAIRDFIKRELGG
jgi:hypothetical protein